MPGPSGKKKLIIMKIMIIIIIIKSWCKLTTVYNLLSRIVSICVLGSAVPASKIPSKPEAAALIRVGCMRRSAGMFYKIAKQSQDGYLRCLRVYCIPNLFSHCMHPYDKPVSPQCLPLPLYHLDKKIKNFTFFFFLFRQINNQLIKPPTSTFESIFYNNVFLLRSWRWCRCRQRQPSENCGC